MQVEHGLDFFEMPIFLPILWFFSTPLKIHQRYQKAKNQENPCSSSHTDISPWHFQNPKPGFEVTPIYITSSSKNN